MNGTRAVVVLAIVVVLVLAPRWWRAWQRTDQRDTGGIADTVFPSLPPALRSPGRTWVVFSTRFCAQCGPLAEWLRTTTPGDEVLVVDAEQDLALAERYRVRSTPTVLVADAEGHVEARLVGADAVRSYAG